MSHKPELQDEIQKVIDLSKQFRQAYPELTDQIDFEQLHNRNPQFQDFLHCFALIASQIRNKIDDGYQNISATLLDSLIPGLLQDKPSMSIIKLQAETHQPITINAHTKLTLSNHNECQFRTLQDCTIYPFSINNIIRQDNKISVQFNLNRQLIKPVKINHIRCYINPRQKNATQLYSALLSDNPGLIKPPPLENNKHPLQCLIDYFHYPNQYYFLDLYFQQKTIDQNFELSYTLTDSIDINKLSIQLSCTPIINLFSHQAEPFVVNPDRPQQNITLNQYKNNLQLHRIKKVTLTNNTDKIQCYNIFDTDYYQRSNETVYWHQDDHQHICFSDHSKLFENAPIVAHLETLCTNGDAPVECLSNPDNQLLIQSDLNDDININASLLHPLSPYQKIKPTDQSRFDLISFSHLSLSSLLQKNNLLRLIALLAQSCNITADTITKNIADVTTKAIKIRPDHVKYHCYYSAINCTITLAATAQSIPEDFIFLKLLNHSLKQYCPINQLFILTLQNRQGEILKQWNPTPGKHYTI